MFSESFMRDFFGLRRDDNPAPAPETRNVTIQCAKSDPLETRAANIVTMIGFAGGIGCFSTPMCSPADATLRALKVLRKYHDLDQE